MMTLTYKGGRRTDFTIVIGSERIYVSVETRTITVEPAIGREILNSDPDNWEVVKAEKPAQQRTRKDDDGGEE